VASFAASVSFDVQPRVLALDETATATLSISGLANAPAPGLPPLNGFQVTSSGSQRSFSFGTGGQDATMAYTYSLTPTAVGTFTIGPFAYEAEGQRFQLPAIQVEVTAPGSATAGGSQPQQWSDLVFAKIVADRTTVYNQENFDLTLEIYFRGINLGREVALLNMPTTGLVLQQFQEVGGGREVINGEIFEIKRYKSRATALTAGKFTLAPTLRVSVLVQGRRRSTGDPFFDRMFNNDFFGNTVEARPLDVTAQPVDVQVNPLPQEGKPQNFSGAVGKFTCDVDVKPTELSVGDPITVTTTISGRGNLATVPAPSIQSGSDFKAYDAKLISKDIDENRSEGRITFEQVLIPKSKDITALPAVGISYFDPEAAAYRTAERGPFPLVIHQGSNVAATLVQGNASAEDTKATTILGNDILYLKPAPSTWQPANPLALLESPVFIGLQVAPPLVLAALFLVARRREELASDISKARREMAPRSARAALAKAEAAATAGNAKAFYDAMWEAQASYFGHRLNLPPGDVTYDIVLGRLESAGLPPASVQWLKSLMELCDQFRFGSGSGPSPDPALIRELGQILRACEKIRL